MMRLDDHLSWDMDSFCIILLSLMMYTYRRICIYIYIHRCMWKYVYTYTYMYRYSRKTQSLRTSMSMSTIISSCWCWTYFKISPARNFTVVQPSPPAKAGYTFTNMDAGPPGNCGNGKCLDHWMFWRAWVSFFFWVVLLMVQKSISRVEVKVVFSII